MGSGCEIAKDASSIIFLDDNFNSVYQATLWGRNILDNIRKFIQFQFPINIVCVIIVFLGGATLGTAPFSVIQLLWINLIMDTLAAISLATEPPSKIQDGEDVFEKRKSDDKIIQPGMWRSISAQVIYQLTVLIVMLYSVPYWFGISYNLVNTSITDLTSVDTIYMKQHYTIVFHTFVMMNLFNQLASRKLGWSQINYLSEIFNNFWFFVVIAGEFTLQWFIVEFSLFNTIFRTQALSWPMHAACFSFGIGALLVSIIAKKALKNKEVFGPKFDFNFNENND